MRDEITPYKDGLKEGAANGRAEAVEELRPIIEQLTIKVRALAKYAPHETTKQAALALAAEADYLIYGE